MLSVDVAPAKRADGMRSGPPSGRVPDKARRSGSPSGRVPDKARRSGSPSAKVADNARQFATCAGREVDEIRECVAERAADALDFERDARDDV